MTNRYCCRRTLRDWLDEDHLAWFVIEAIEELDLEPFFASYRADGHGRAAHDPKMMVTLLTYAYAVGERSSRGIERRCREDVAFRVICANQVPDHATIARFRVRHQEALGDLFGQVLGLCAQAGLVDVGVIALDGSKFAAAASDSAIRTYEQIATEILEEAGRIDAAEDQVEALGIVLAGLGTLDRGRVERPLQQLVVVAVGAVVVEPDRDSRSLREERALRPPGSVSGITTPTGSRPSPDWLWERVEPLGLGRSPPYRDRS